MNQICFEKPYHHLSHLVNASEMQVQTMRNFQMPSVEIRIFLEILCITKDLLHPVERSAETALRKHPQKKIIAFAPQWRHKLVSIETIALPYSKSQNVRLSKNGYFVKITPPSRKKCGNRSPEAPTKENHCFCATVETQARKYRDNCTSIFEISL